MKLEAQKLPCSTGDAKRHRLILVRKDPDRVEMTAHSVFFSNPTRKVWQAQFIRVTKRAGHVLVMEHAWMANYLPNMSLKPFNRVKNTFFNKQCWNNWILTRLSLDPESYYHTQWLILDKVKTKIINLWGKQTFIFTCNLGVRTHFLDKITLKCANHHIWMPYIWNIAHGFTKNMTKQQRWQYGI